MTLMPFIYDIDTTYSNSKYGLYFDKLNKFYNIRSSMICFLIKRKRNIYETMFFVSNIRR